MSHKAGGPHSGLRLLQHTVDLLLRKPLAPHLIRPGKRWTPIATGGNFPWQISQHSIESYVVQWTIKFQKRSCHLEKFAHRRLALPRADKDFGPDRACRFWQLVGRNAPLPTPATIVAAYGLTAIFLGKNDPIIYRSGRVCIAILNSN